MFAFAQTKSPLRNAITEAYRKDEASAVMSMLAQASMDAQGLQNTEFLARKLVAQVRQNRSKASGVDALMHEFSLSSEEGVALMCLAEALLRVPDTATQDQLIRDKLSGANWKAHINQSPSLFVNAAAWGLLVTGKLADGYSSQGLGAALTRLVAKGGEPLIRRGVDFAMRLLGKQFVTGQTIDEALKNGKEREEMGYRFSFDMLGEAAMTEEDAQKYFNDYVMAIHAIGKDSKGTGVYEGNGISVKLSAIHPRYSRAQYDRVMAELLPRLKELFLLAKQYNIGLNIDAEEADRLELSLDLIEALARDEDLKGFEGIGIVVQAYQKRCPFVIDYLIDLAKQTNHRFMIRLVKGAYWDSEIKRAQVDGLDGYPVYTRKVYTDVSYLACAKKLLAAPEAVFPQFATHNAYSLAAVFHMAGEDADYEFQCLHGMGETLYNQVVGAKNLNRRCRIYAPVGTHQTLLAYLVRRLLENGANSSFVNRIVDEKVSIDELVQSPLVEAANFNGKMHGKLSLPRNLYGKIRLNSQGIDLSNEHSLNSLQVAMNQAAASTFQAASLLATPLSSELNWLPVLNPANHDDKVGEVAFASSADVSAALTLANDYKGTWASVAGAERSAMLNRFADLMEENLPTLMMLAVREAGKTLSNAIAEVREAVDFCRYYAVEAATYNSASHPPLGLVVTISPWNFPLAIFVGEMVSALVSGNVVVAKPAEQTSLIAHYAVGLLHQAGVPKEALQLLLGDGTVGAQLTSDERVGGIIFTGSTEVARLINQNLSKRSDNPVLIAETGGQNAMIVDSTALPEQVVTDVLQSAFDSAGQRCSALRVLFLQDDVADKILEMIKGAMDELKVGNPALLNTDVGPVIDAEAQGNLAKHIDHMKGAAKKTHQIKLPEGADKATFIAPTLFELNDLSELKREVFGPVLHVVRFAAKNLDNVIKQINQTGFALTHGIHSRIDHTVEYISQNIQAGNVYVNRNIVGAVVGVQPFGGHGLSGTGPKAGGAFYTQRLTHLANWRLPEGFKGAKPELSKLSQITAALSKLPLSQSDAAHMQDLINQSREGSLVDANVTLPSVTGEENIYALSARGKILIHGGDLAHALSALIQVAASDSLALVSKDSPLAEFAPLMSDALKVVDNELDTEASLWLAVGEVAPATKEALAAQSKKIVTISCAKEKINQAQLYFERSISINTTAAGGNASLMAMSE